MLRGCSFPLHNADLHVLAYIEVAALGLQLPTRENTDMNHCFETQPGSLIIQIPPNLSGCHAKHPVLGFRSPSTHFCFCLTFGRPRSCTVFYHKATRLTQPRWISSATCRIVLPGSAETRAVSSGQPKAKTGCTDSETRGHKGGHRNTRAPGAVPRPYSCPRRQAGTSNGHLSPEGWPGLMLGYACL